MCIFFTHGHNLLSRGKDTTFWSRLIMLFPRLSKSCVIKSKSDQLANSIVSCEDANSMLMSGMQTF